MQNDITLQHVLTGREEGNDLGDEKGKDPSHQQDAGPRAPAEDSVLSQMSRVVEQAEEGPARGNRGVKASQEDESGNHEGEGNLLVQRV